MDYFLAWLRGAGFLLYCEGLFTRNEIQPITDIQPVIVTARVAKRAKVMFLQAFVCPTRGGGGKVDDQGPGHNTSLSPPTPGTRSQHLTPPDQVTTPPSLHGWWK